MLMLLLMDLRAFLTHLFKATLFLPESLVDAGLDKLCETFPCLSLIISSKSSSP